MKLYRIVIYENEDRTTSEFYIHSKDKLNAIKDIIVYFINNTQYNIDNIDIQYIEELIEDDEL